MRIISNEEPEYHCIMLDQKTNIKIKNDKARECPGIAKGVLDHLNENPSTYLVPATFLIVVTMYNEDPILFHKTMSAIYRNLERFTKEGIDINNIAVAVIVDGVKPFTEGLKSDDDIRYYSKLFDLEKVYKYHKVENPDSSKRMADLQKVKILIPKNEDMNSLKNSQRKAINPQELQNQYLEKIKDRYYEYAHLFVNTVSFEEGKECKLKVYFCVKQDNKRKLNSHLWFFGGLCRVIDPKYCMLIDVGTEPEDSALYLLYNALRRDTQVAGVCGEIIPKSDKDSLFDVLCYAQKVEYKFSHVLDKSLESLLGYITVLPGAFSAYRYDALQPDDPKGPLWGEYFKSIRKPWLMDCYHANIYLAEDRVLCLSLVSCKDKNYILKFVRKSRAYTDPPPDYEALLSQRRRWINGSWFALLDSVRNTKKVWASDHNCCRKMIFTFQMLYYIVNILYSFVMVGGFYLALSICLRKMFDNKSGRENSIGTVLMVFYLSMLIITFVISLGSRIRDANKALWAISGIFSMYMGLFLVLLISLFFDNWDDASVFAPVAATVSGFVILLVMNDSLWLVVLGCIQFLIATPTYMNIFTIYAICNIHDCSWGNRPENMTAEEANRMDDFEQFRTGWVLLWAFINVFFAYVLDAADESDTSYAGYIYAVGIIGMSVIYIRFLGGFVFIIKQKCFKYTFTNPDEIMKEDPNINLRKA
ncbi:hypothetical protein SteCoe_24238 [Stentor coeruleus]|uniref:chitin synthase n=1 Tax=Stentor coeruleus TaxID=5963 RepID=A0A1R2BI02_9CILI|nr:hypothetical protein SteCoe_24238 [Stentor coeruleus]